MGKLKSAIIIGGGVSGLAAGIKLAKQGLDVKLFEINDKLGGSCATIVQEGYVFAEGALWVVAPGLLEHGFHRMGLDLRSLLPMRRINANMKLTLPDSSTVTIDNENEVTERSKA